MENLEKKTLMEYMNIEKKEPQNKTEIENLAQAIGISLELLHKVKEEQKQLFKEENGMYPTHSEGCCIMSSQSLLKFIKGHLRGGWFTTDTLVKAKDVRYIINGLPKYVCDIDEHDNRKLTHWWVEYGNYIIDLTAEQFNRFLEEKMEKVEIIPMGSPKAQRYESQGWEDGSEEDDEPDWENDDGEWQDRDQ